MSEIAKSIERYLIDDPELAAGRSSIGHSESLIEGGLIESVGILKLIAFLEETFDIMLDEADITAENFATIRCIAELVEARSDG